MQFKNVTVNPVSLSDHFVFRNETKKTDDYLFSTAQCMFVYVFVSVEKT